MPYARMLNDAEHRYSVGEKEALACLWTSEHWHFYLYGRPFVLRTDHQALTYDTAYNKRGRQTAVTIASVVRSSAATYNYTVEYQPGPTNCVPDILSRCTKPALIRAEATSNDDQNSAQINWRCSVDELEYVNYATVRSATDRV
jgi:RNase H-like domain found in reverse transcriptase